MNNKFVNHSKYSPSGDQPQAIEKLVDGLTKGDDAQTLLGITGSGKTFTIANVIERIQRNSIKKNTCEEITRQAKKEIIAIKNRKIAWLKGLKCRSVSTQTINPKTKQILKSQRIEKANSLTA